MDKPIPEAVVAEAAALLTKWLDADECECEPYGHSCGRPDVIRVRDDLLALTAAQQPDHIVDATKMVAQQQGQAEPIGWTFQHDETGRISFCPNDGVNTPENFAANNPRYTLCGPAYSSPQPMQQGGGDATFAAWLATEMPAGTVIGDPAWWANRISRQYAKRCAPPSAPVGVELPEGFALNLSVAEATLRKLVAVCPVTPPEAAAIRSVIVGARALAQQPAAGALSRDELDTCRQWFDSVQDTNGGYLAPADYVLAAKLYQTVGMRVPDSIGRIATQHQEPTT